MASRWSAEKRAVAAAAQEMASQGLVTGTSGNVSVRLASGEGAPLLAITPSGTRYDGMTEEDVVVTDFDVEQVEGEGTPSSESLTHVAIYRARPDVHAVIHTHPLFGSAAAVAGRDIPPIVDEMTITLGGPVKVSEYAFPGSEEMAQAVCAALGERNAALIRNHGAVGVGRTLREALDVCILTERVAQIFLYAGLLGNVQSLPEEIVEAETAIFRMMRDASG